MKSFKSKNPKLDSVDLNYNCFTLWFCRVWHIDWLERIGQRQNEYGEGAGKTKFEAHRNALKNLNSESYKGKMLG